VRRNPLAKVLLPVSSVYDRHDSMNGMDDDNFYFEEPGRLHGHILVKRPLFLSRTWLFKRAGLISLRKQLFSLDKWHFLLRNSAVLTKEHPVAREKRRYYHHVSRFPY
jgi:hypothetical protein